MLRSMFSHSSSSSPDILGPPGDVDYLISSPFKAFSGRQSSLMSPANLRILQTPGPGRKKRSRISLSPAKSAHSIRFDDVLLPGSPTMKLDRRQGSLSPTKAQAEGNVSPWRIRVTLEATQDDEPNKGSPSRKRSKPSTTTTKIPLKDGLEQTPRRPRGRPRKSGPLDATPRTGSPGNTPGPGVGGNSEQKRRRGRPRKHQPESDALGGDDLVEAQAAAQAAELERRSWSPLNLAGDADSDDGLYDNPALGAPFEDLDKVELLETDQATGERNYRTTFEPTYDTPNGDAINRFHLQQGDDDLHSTPSKMPSPTHDLQDLSPENTLNAGHTPRPPRIYPTPTASSLVDDERQEQNHSAQETSITASKPNQPTGDPTDEHREFDSIMESEGFSMVSLGTLPSAGQHGLRSDSKLAKGPLKPFVERETNGVLKRKAHILDRPPEDIFAPSPSPDPIPSPAKPHFSPPKLKSEITTKRRLVSSPTFSSKSTSIPRRRPFFRLAKLVRAGIALGRVLESDPAFTTSRERLEAVFNDLNPDSRRLLRGALGLGQELAKRRRLTEIQSPRRQASVEEDLGYPDLDHAIRHMSSTPNRQYDGAVDSSPSSEMKQRFEEWQREREAVSRAIQMANSSQVIVLDSDVSGTPSSEGAEDVHNMDESHRTSEQVEAELGEEEMEMEEEEGEVDLDVDEDEGYEDIWQEQAKDEGNSNRGSVFDSQKNMQSSSWKGGSTPADREYGRTVSPAYWVDGQSKVPFLGQSRIRELREQEVDISALLRAEDTPNRARYYYGKSSPRSITHERSPQYIPSSAVSQGRKHAEQYADELDVEPEVEPEDYFSFSPHRDLEDETFQIDPTTRHETEMQRHQSEFTDNANILDAVDEGPTVQDVSLTPRNADPADKSKQTSTWFQRITSLTPGWLKAPIRDSSPQHSPLGSKSPSPHEEDTEEDESHLEEQVREEDDVGEIERLPSVAERESEIEQRTSPNTQDRSALPSETPKLEEETPERQSPRLATSGYFSDAHYSLLRRLHRFAKQSPESFPYYPTPAHSDIIGDYIWTSDNTYGVPITELQFAIVHRFRQELAVEDLKSGGNGWVGWSDADLHRRLVSVIIGEQIREDRKEQLNTRRSSMSKSIVQRR